MLSSSAFRVIVGELGNDGIGDDSVLLALLVTALLSSLCIGVATGVFEAVDGGVSSKGRKAKLRLGVGATFFFGIKCDR